MRRVKKGTVQQGKCHLYTLQKISREKKKGKEKKKKPKETKRK